jgi:uridine phosphorylase
VLFRSRNFPEDASSKPVHVAVNDLSNVIKFGIASSSEEFYEQRRCYIRLSKTNHEQAFYNALIAMGVVAVVVDGEVLSLSDFLSLLKS